MEYGPGIGEFQFDRAILRCESMPGLFFAVNLTGTLIRYGILFTQMTEKYAAKHMGLHV